MGITGFEMVATEVWAHKHINHSNKFQLDATHRLENHRSLPIWLTAFLLSYGVYFSWRGFSEVTATISATIGNGTYFSRKVDWLYLDYVQDICFSLVWPLAQETISVSFDVCITSHVLFRQRNLIQPLQRWPGYSSPASFPGQPQMSSKDWDTFDRSVACLELLRLYEHIEI